MALALHYQGAQDDRLAPASEAVSLSDYDVLPAALARDIAGIERLDINEPLSFPFEDLPETAWKVPLTIHLPNQGAAGSDARSLLALLGPDVLSRLTTLDVVSAPDRLWSDLVVRYGWPTSMRVSPQTYSTNTEIQDAKAIEANRASYGSSPYDSFTLRTVQSKERLLAVCSVLARNLRRSRQSLFRDPAMQLHGCHTSPFVPLMWSGLTAVFEHTPGERQRLKKNYDHGQLRLFDQATTAAARDSLIESADIVVGVGNLTQTDDVQLQNAFSTMFENLRVGGTLVICERLNGRFGPNDLLELLLDTSNHDLVMDDMETVRVPSDTTHGYAVIAFSKLGTPLR